MKSTYLLTILLSLFSLCAYAQNNVILRASVIISSNALINIVVSDSINADPLVGANIQIVSGNDTIRGYTARTTQLGTHFAIYECQKRFRKPVELTVSSMGYKTLRRTYKGGDFLGQINVELIEDPMAIASIEVVGNRVAMIIRGDTTIYKADAFKTMAGDKLSELLQQLPGVRVTEQGIFADGVQIKRVYVDGKNFFGYDTSSPLTDVTAEDVTSVKVYDEESSSAKRVGDKMAPKDKVMDVVTRSKPDVIKNIMLDLSGGSSTNREYDDHLVTRTSQYGLVGINMPTGNYRLTAYNYTNGFISGVTDYTKLSTPTLGHNTDINGSYSYRPNDSLMVSVNIGYVGNKTETESKSTRSYFPSELYAMRLIENTNRTVNKRHEYSFNSSIDMGRRHYHITGSASLKYGTSASEDAMSMLNRTDDIVLNQRQTATSDGDNYAGSARLFYDQGLGQLGILRTNAEIDVSRNSTNGWRVDTLGSSSLRTLLNNDLRGLNLAAKAEAWLSKSISQSSRIDLQYRIDYSHRSARQMSLDFLHNPAGVMDSVNTYDYTIDRTRNELEIGYGYRTENHSLSVGLIGRATSMARDERLPDNYHQPYHFYSLLPKLNYNYKESLFINIGSDTEEISVEQLRDVVDNSNPLFLRVGNSDLKLPVNTNGSISFRKTVAARALSLSLSLRGSYTNNYIATKTLFFTDETYLPQYDYTAVKGASLSTVANAGESYSLSPSLSIDKRLGAIASTLKIDIGYRYAVTPFFLDELARTTSLHELDMKIKLTAGFSQYIKPELYSLTRAGIVTSGPYGRSRYIDEQLSGVIKTNFAKRYLVNTMATYALYRNDSAPNSARDDIFWNIEMGRTFGKKKQLRVMAGVIDILNRAANRTVIIRDDYISSSSTSSLGRYWFLDVMVTF